MSSSNIDEAVRVRNWPITINYSSYIRLWSISYFYSLIHYCYCRPCITQCRLCT